MILLSIKHVIYDYKTTVVHLTRVTNTHMPVISATQEEIIYNVV
jgi:hypothetical protein